MIFEIPTTPSLPYYKQTTSLDGSAYELVFHWNERDFHWYLDINDQATNPLVMGTKIVCESTLLKRVINLNAPPGELLAYDSTASGLDPGLDDFGTRVKLLYYDKTEPGATRR